MMSETLLEIDFVGNDAVRAGDPFGIGNMQKQTPQTDNKILVKTAAIEHPIPGTPIVVDVRIGPTNNVKA
jgi:hypothetical protein